MSLSRSWKATIAAGLLLAAAIGLLASFFPWNWLRQPIEERVSDAIGRRLEIGGDLEGEWSLHPRVRMGWVRLANPEWAHEADFLSADAVTFRIDLPALLAGRIRLRDVALERPVLALERAADGRRTWLFDREQQDEAHAPRIEDLRVDNGELRVRDVMSNTELSVTLSGSESSGEVLPLRISAAGTLRGEPLEVTGATTSLLRLRDLSLPVPFTLRGKVARTRIALEGEVTELARFAEADIRYDVQGASLKLLGPVFGVALPETPAYRVSGRLRHSGARWETTDMKGKAGNSDLAGTVVVLQHKPRPKLEARLESKLLDMADLGPLIGAAPRGARTAAANRERILPDIPFDMSRADALDADVVIDARQVRDVARFPLDNFYVHFRLKDGRIVADPLRFGLAGGSFVTRVEMDGGQPIAARVQGRVRGLKIAQLLPEQAATGEAAGSLTGSVELRGRGNSVAQILGTANGRAALLLTDGSITSLWPAVADLDGRRVLKNYFGGSAPETIRCTVADLELKNGVAVPRIMVIDTETTVISIAGSANLADETVAARITQAPKQPSVLSVRTPINVEGSLSAPRVSLDKAGLLARGAGAVVLALVNPLASALALLEPGPGKDTGCDELVRDLRERQPSVVTRHRRAGPQS